MLISTDQTKGMLEITEDYQKLQSLSQSVLLINLSLLEGGEFEQMFELFLAVIITAQEAVC